MWTQLKKIEYNKTLLSDIRLNFIHPRYESMLINGEMWISTQRELINVIANYELVLSEYAARNV